MTSPDDRGIPRREFVKAAVAIGGASALSACVSRESADVPRGPEDLSSFPQRQHAWNDVLKTDKHGNVIAPRHRILLLLNYRGDGTPTSDDRRTMESAFQSLEHAYPRDNEGILFTVSYSPAYFERFDDPLPESIDLPMPEALASFEDPKLDTPDAVVHLASDYGKVVLAAEEALRGNKETLNGVDVAASLDGVFEFVDRRTGFVGDGLPAKNDDVSGVPEGEVPEEAPLYMGFESGFSKNQASEDRVSIQNGPFADGTTQHVSNLTLNLNQWYQQDDRFQRVSKMFCPHHAKEGTVEGTGENLKSSQMDECKPADEAAREDAVVGHSQKMVDVREDDRAIILRRDFDSTDGGHAGLHFLSVQRTISDFVDTRKAMNGTGLAEDSAVGQRNNNGILQYIDVERRGNYLVPPRRHRALPPANPKQVEAVDA